MLASKRKRPRSVFSLYERRFRQRRRAKGRDKKTKGVSRASNRSRKKRFCSRCSCAKRMATINMTTVNTVNTADPARIAGERERKRRNWFVFSLPEYGYAWTGASRARLSRVDETADGGVLGCARNYGTDVMVNHLEQQRRERAGKAGATKAVWWLGGLQGSSGETRAYRLRPFASQQPDADKCDCFLTPTKGSNGAETWPVLRLRAKHVLLRYPAAVAWLTVAQTCSSHVRVGLLVRLSCELRRTLNDASRRPAAVPQQAEPSWVAGAFVMVAANLAHNALFHCANRDNGYAGSGNVPEWFLREVCPATQQKHERGAVKATADAAQRSETHNQCRACPICAQHAVLGCDTLVPLDSAFSPDDAGEIPVERTRDQTIAPSLQEAADWHPLRGEAGPAVGSAADAATGSVVGTASGDSAGYATSDTAHLPRGPSALLQDERSLVALNGDNGVPETPNVQRCSSTWSPQTQAPEEQSSQGEQGLHETQVPGPGAQLPPQAAESENRLRRLFRAWSALLVGSVPEDGSQRRLDSRHFDDRLSGQSSENDASLSRGNPASGLSNRDPESSASADRRVSFAPSGGAFAAHRLQWRFLLEAFRLLVCEAALTGWLGGRRPSQVSCADAAGLYEALESLEGFTALRTDNGCLGAEQRRPAVRIARAFCGVAPGKDLGWDLRQASVCAVSSGDAVRRCPVAAPLLEEKLNCDPREALLDALAFAPTAAFLPTLVVCATAATCEKWLNCAVQRPALLSRGVCVWQLCGSEGHTFSWRVLLSADGSCPKGCVLAIALARDVSSPIVSMVARPQWGEPPQDNSPARAAGARSSATQHTASSSPGSTAPTSSLDSSGLSGLPGASGVLGENAFSQGRNGVALTYDVTGSVAEGRGANGTARSFLGEGGLFGVWRPVGVESNALQQTGESDGQRQEDEGFWRAPAEFPRQQNRPGTGSSVAQQMARAISSLVTTVAFIGEQSAPQTRQALVLVGHRPGRALSARDGVYGCRPTADFLEEAPTAVGELQAAWNTRSWLEASSAVRDGYVKTNWLERWLGDQPDGQRGCVAAVRSWWKADVSTLRRIESRLASVLERNAVEEEQGNAPSLTSVRKAWGQLRERAKAMHQAACQWKRHKTGFPRKLLGDSVRESLGECDAQQMAVAAVPWRAVVLDDHALAGLDSVWRAVLELRSAEGVYGVRCVAAPLWGGVRHCVAALRGSARLQSEAARKHCEFARRAPRTPPSGRFPETRAVPRTKHLVTTASLGSSLVAVATPVPDGARAAAPVGGYGAWPAADCGLASKARDTGKRRNRVALCNGTTESGSTLWLAPRSRETMHLAEYALAWQSECKRRKGGVQCRVFRPAGCPAWLCDEVWRSLRQNSTAQMKVDGEAREHEPEVTVALALAAGSDLAIEVWPLEHTAALSVWAETEAACASVRDPILWNALVWAAASSIGTVARNRLTESGARRALYKCVKRLAKALTRPRRRDRHLAWLRRIRDSRHNRQVVFADLAHALLTVAPVSSVASTPSAIGTPGDLEECVSHLLARCVPWLQAEDATAEQEERAHREPLLPVADHAPAFYRKAARKAARRVESNRGAVDRARHLVSGALRRASDGEQCPVCMERVADVLWPTCGHSVCAPCTVQMQKTEGEAPGPAACSCEANLPAQPGYWLSCPVCRTRNYVCACSPLLWLFASVPAGNVEERSRRYPCARFGTHAAELARWAFEQWARHGARPRPLLVLVLSGRIDTVSCSALQESLDFVAAQSACAKGLVVRCSALGPRAQFPAAPAMPLEDRQLVLADASGCACMPFGCSDVVFVEELGVDAGTALFGAASLKGLGSKNQPEGLHGFPRSVSCEENAIRVLLSLLGAAFRSAPPGAFSVTWLESHADDANLRTWRQARDAVFSLSTAQSPCENENAGSHDRRCPSAKR